MSRTIAPRRELSLQLPAEAGPLSGCTCIACQMCCFWFPGRMTPAEANAAIDAGNGSKLMQITTHGGFALLMPKMVDEFDRPTTAAGEGRCVFLDANWNCTVHKSGYKPIQCRLTLGCHRACPPEAATDAVEKLWENPEGIAAFRRFIAEASK